MRKYVYLMLVTLVTSAVADDHKPTNTSYNVTTYAVGLFKPWGMTFLPDGHLLVTEKSGNLRLVNQQGEISVPLNNMLPVKHAGQGGLLDVTLDPDFSNNQLIYFSYSKDAGNDQAKTAVGKARLNGNSLEDVSTIWEQKDAVNGGYHYGSRLVFDRTGHLFVTTGDRHFGKDLVQKMDNHFGKIVRIDTNGQPAKDNPFIDQPGVLPDIYSSGHRNAQGAFLHPQTGELWANEHGPRGGDEINRVQPGKNYGWPTITYGINYNGTPITDKTAMPGMEQPVHYWDPSIATSGMLIYTGNAFPEWQGNIFTGALKLMHLSRIELDDQLKVVNEEQLLLEQKERIRAIEQGPDGHIYVATDSDNGRILKISPAE